MTVNDKAARIPFMVATLDALCTVWQETHDQGAVEDSALLIWERWIEEGWLDLATASVVDDELPDNALEALDIVYYSDWSTSFRFRGLGEAP